MSQNNAQAALRDRLFTLRAEFEAPISQYAFLRHVTRVPTAFVSQPNKTLRCYSCFNRPIPSKSRFHPYKTETMNWFKRRASGAPSLMVDL